ncbi:MAG: hypothetical protein R6V19_09020, partial [Armatimonadota bacterium]
RRWSPVQCPLFAFRILPEYDVNRICGIDGMYSPRLFRTIYFRFEPLQQVQTLTNGTSHEAPTEVTPLLERLEAEIDGAK